MTVYLALYKGKKSGKWTNPKVLAARVADWVIRKATGGIYSHCELAIRISDDLYECYSSSMRDGGVRQKYMSLPSEQWDLIPLTNVPDSQVREHFKHTAGMKYDWRGAIGSKLTFVGHSASKYFCSEWCAEGLRLAYASLYNPNSLAKEVIKWFG